MPDLLDRIRRELDDRIAALRPVAEEYGRLQRAADALDAAAGARAAAAVATTAERPQTPARRRGEAGAKRTGRRRATTGRAAPGQTQLRVIAQLRSHPGSSSTAVAQAVGISANAAAATISRLVKQGRVRRLETGGYATTQAPSEDAPTAGA